MELLLEVSPRCALASCAIVPFNFFHKRNQEEKDFTKPHFNNNTVNNSKCLTIF